MERQYGKLGIGEIVGGFIIALVVVGVVIDRVGSWEVVILIGAIAGFGLLGLWLWRTRRRR